MSFLTECVSWRVQIYFTKNLTGELLPNSFSIFNDLCERWKPKLQMLWSMKTSADAFLASSSVFEVENYCKQQTKNSTNLYSTGPAVPEGGREERRPFYHWTPSHLRTQNYAAFSIHQDRKGPLCGHSSIFTSVNGSFYAAHCPSAASGLIMIEILLTGHGVVSVCGMLIYFFPRTHYSAGDTACREWPFFVFRQEDSHFWARVCARACVCVCAHKSICVLQERPLYLILWMIR